MMFIDFHEFIKNTEEVVKEVCSFVGAEPDLYSHRPQPPGMKVVLTLPSPPLPALQMALQQVLLVPSSSCEACSLSICNALTPCMPHNKQIVSCRFPAYMNLSSLKDA